VTEEVMSVKFAYLERETAEMGITGKAMADRIADIEKISVRQEVTLGGIVTSVKIIEYTFIAFVATNVIMWLSTLFKIK
jgi:hypothetical protein